MNALICGVTGQDGAYLAKLLLSKGYRVFGTSRDVARSPKRNLQTLEIVGQVEYINLDITDYKSVLTALQKSQPDEIYNLAGQSSVGVSYELPFETIRSFTLGVLNIMEGMRFLNLRSRLFNASSGECFGETDMPANELTAFSPKSPYAVAKASAYWSVNNYREAYSLYCCSGVLFSHESPLRNHNFVSQKIISTARDIKQGKADELVLGRIDILRDWGWAPDYVNAMWLMLQQDEPKDYVIATGVANQLEDFVRLCFEGMGLDYQDYLKVSDKYFRPNDIKHSVGDPSAAYRDFGWKPTLLLPDVIDKMLESAFIKATD